MSELSQSLTQLMKVFFPCPAVDGSERGALSPSKHKPSMGFPVEILGNREDFEMRIVIAEVMGKTSTKQYQRVE